MHAAVSPVVLGVYERVLGEILDGTRTAGSTIKDVEVARELGVSRTPVREALQMLRNIGVVEVTPSRFTRIAVHSMDDLEEMNVVMQSLYGVLIPHLLSLPTPPTVDGMRAATARAREGIDDRKRFFDASVNFHEEVVAQVGMTHLLRTMESTVHAFRLAMLTNFEEIDRETVVAGQEFVADVLAGVLVEYDQRPPVHVGLPMITSLRRRDAD